MKKQHVPTNQLTLFSPQFDSSIRHTMHNQEMYYSLVDIVAYFTSTSQASRYWNESKKQLQKEGFELFGKIEKLDFLAPDGKYRGTECANMDTCLRILMAIPTPKNEEKKRLLEAIKQWLASLGAKEIESAAARKREKNILLHNEAGLGNTPEALHYVARHENIETWKHLFALIKQICDNPQFGKLTNAEYMAIFGETSESLKVLLHTKSIRDNLTTTQIRTLTYAEDTLRDILAGKKQVTNDDIMLTIQQVFPPIGNMLKAIMNAQGLDHITGKELPPVPAKSERFLNSYGRE